ncbi:MAG TPA: RNA polymerase sigma factor [Candidatus Dormibacteraeota bacterium]|nr:RNA polymerase sigma factor [Candidatus Dormibacteraeota bacterium]
MAWRRHRRGAARGRPLERLTETHTAADSAVAAVFREEAGRLTAALVHALGDFDLAEEVVQDSLVAALEKWPEQGIPDKPGAWLMTTARRRAIDILRRDKRYREKLVLLERSDLRPDAAEADDRLRLIFTCCHPALSQEAQVALTLRAVAGFTTAEIAGAFLVAEATVAQRIVRAKRKIVDAKIPYRVPASGELASRLDGVLSVLYLMFNEGYLSRGPLTAMRRDLADDALWLTGLVATLMPDEPEVIGLLALMKVNLARSPARFDAAGEMILLPDQDRSLWDQRSIAEGVALLERAGGMRRTGPYQVQGAIAALHSEAASWTDTDWHQIVLLYDALVRMADSPVIRLNRAVALSHFAGPEAALGEVNDLAIELSGYHLFHSTRAELLDQVGEPVLARTARRRALELCQNPAERSLLERKLRT